MFKTEFVELTGEAHEAAITFRRKMLEAAEESKLDDRILLAMIAQEMGHLVAIHTLNGCCDPEELTKTMMLNFRQGVVDRFAEGIDETTRPRETRVH